MEKKTRSSPSKPRELTPSVRQLIIQRAINQRKIPREFLAHEIIKEIKDMGEIPPSFETCKRYISQARNNYNPLDNPWNLACCSQYSSFFPPDSIPFLVDCKQFIEREMATYNKLFTEMYGSPMSSFSIRIVIWMVRLKPLIEKIFADEIAKFEDSIYGLVFIFANIYGSNEIACEILGIVPFDSSVLDDALVSRDFKKLGKINSLALFATSKPIKECDHNCEPCKYYPIPWRKGFCILKIKKESSK